MAPDFNLTARKGTASLAALRGKVVYVDFWASWCGPCAKSFPWLKAMHEQYAAKGLDIVAINLDKDRGKAEEFLAGHPAPFMVAFDPKGTTAEAYHVAGMPSSYLIDAAGKIVFVHTGFAPKDAAQLEARIKEECTK
jgi:thiol-disulfide isomerase/thioredoxin